MNGLSLFSGIGGLDVALSGYVRPIAYCEIDPYCQAVLLNRQFDGLLPRAPIWDDITTLHIRGNGRNINIIYGGFPCQDISIAGHGKGLAGERSGLFYEIVLLAKEIEPKFIFLENVPAITTRGGIQVVGSIAKMGYDCRWCCISAASVGALHKRERWFLLAHSTSKSTNRYSIRKKEEYAMFRNSSKALSNSRCECERSKKKPEWPSLHFTGCPRIWEVEPEMGRLVDGLPLRLEQLRALGNAVVPQQAKKAFEILMGIKDASDGN